MWGLDSWGGGIRLWIHEEDANSESELVGKLKPKRKNLAKDRWKIPYALFSSFLMIIGPLGGQGGPTYREVSVDDLPFDEYFAGPTDVTIDVVDVDEQMTLAVSFHKTHNYSVNLTVDSEDYGSIDYGRSIFVVPISENATLQFNAIQLTIHIERVWREGIVNNTHDDVIVKGKTYAEPFQRSEGGKLMGHRVFLQIPTGHEHNVTIKSVDAEPMEYYALTNMQILVFGVVAAPQTETNFSYDINLLKLSMDNQTRFVVEIERGDEHSADFFREFLPEMTVQDDEITLSNETPEEGQEINITVKVWNEGDVPAENCTVTVYIDRVNSTRVVGEDVVSLNPQSNETLIFPWNTTDVHGQHKIHVVLDEKNVIEEYNESDHGSHSVFVNSSELSVDTDGDGLPDFWEDRYGLNSSSSQGDDGAAGDPDDDGLNNTGEFGNNTSPVDSDTDDDNLLDGVNNTLIHITLDNITIGQNFTPPQGSSEYYMRMHRYEMDDGETFPFAGYREPSSGYWNLSQINPVGNLSNSYITEGIPMEVYHKYVEDPIARFLVYANKSTIIATGSEVRSYSNENVTVNVTLASMEYAFSDPDPLMVDADWDGLDDEWEVLYWSTRLIDFRGADSDSDSLDNLLDPDSYDDGLYDGKEVRVFHYPTYSTEQYNSSVFQYPVYDYGDSHTEKYRYPLFAIDSASLNSSVHGAIIDSLDADTDDDNLDDGEEVYSYWTNPRLSDTDLDGMTDGFEVKSWFYFENDTLSFEYFDEEGSSLFNISHYPIGKFNLTISGRVRVNNKTTGHPDNALNVTLITVDGDHSVSYSVSFDSSNLTTDFEEVNATYKLQLDIAQVPLQLWVQSNESVFGKFSPFRVFLDDVGVDMYGVNPNEYDMDSDGYNDTQEQDYGTAAGKTDTESDGFCDAAEVNFWQIGRSYTLAESLSRAKDPDIDDDGIPDGVEAIMGLDLEDDDPDNDGLTDYQEAIAFIGMFMTFIDDHIVNQGNFTRPFSTAEEGIYMVKIMSEDSVARREENVSDHWIPGQHIWETPTNDFMRESVNISILKDNETVGGVVWYTGCAVQPVSKEYGWLNITEKRFFAVYGNLSANTSYDIRFELNVTEDAVVDMQFTSIQLLKQGLDPFNSDADDDGLSDGLEMQIGSDPFTPHSDRDEVNDYHEYNGTLTGYSTNPAMEDTDGDGLWDGNDTNVQAGSYKFQLVSAEEITGEAEYGTNPTDTDTDDDGLWDGETVGEHPGEMDYDTNATLWDTDGDSAPDGWEAQYYPSLDPTNHDGQNDTDSDNLTNVQEYITSTNPTLNDTDLDGIFDGDEILGLLFRTNVSEGAESIDNYGEGGNFQWIVWNGTQKKYFQYNSGSTETEEKLSSTGAQRNPQISGNYIVWENFSDSDKYDVYLYNVSNSTAFRISPSDSNQTWVKMHGEYVVWQDERNESAGYDIYLYNITDEVEVRITNDTANQTRPSIYGNYIVWSDYRHANESNGWQWEIYAYDLEREIEIRITNDTTNSTGTRPSQTFPYVYENRIVWIDKRNGSYNVYLHELSGGTFVTNDSLDQSLPMVGKDFVVWEEPVNGTLKVMVLSLKTRTTSRLSAGSSSQQNPYVSGDKVVWQDNRTGNWDIFLHNLTTGRTYQITDDSHQQTWPVVVGDTILWVDDRNSDDDIYAYFLDYALTLEDGSLVYYNSERDELYVWEEDSVFFRFNSTQSSIPETNDRPVPGYHAMELFKGPIPSIIDSDDDGIPDGAEPNWSEDTDNDGYIDSMDSDSDDDLVPDYKEVRVRFRTNAENEEFGNDTWIAIDLNLSNEKYKLVGYWYNYYTFQGGDYPPNDFEAIENQTTPLGKAIFRSPSNESIVAVGEEVPYNWSVREEYSYFWESDMRAIVTEVYASADYARNRKEASIVIGCSSDNDTTPNVVDNDSDADGILDGIEPLWYQDVDQDGFINMMDADSDGDGLNDTDEDINFNGKVDTNETSTITMDTDSDGIIDPVEVAFVEDDPDEDGIWNAQDIDSDGDGVVDGNEVRITYRTNALRGIYNSSTWVAVCIDTDGWDEEIYPPYGWDLDGFWLYQIGPTPPGSRVYLGDTPEGMIIWYSAPSNKVTIEQDDGYAIFTSSSSKSIDKSESPTLAFSSKGKEVVIIYNVTWDGSPNILNNDSDNDNLIDGLEDANGNGIIDSMETNPWTKDTDGDGISDGIEDANLNGTVQADETDPLDMDTDDDGLIDGWDDENGNGTLDSGEAEGEDLDGDGEVDTNETDPLSWDTDEDGLSDGQEVGLDTPQTEDTNTTFFVPDGDSGTTVTNATDDDSDDDGLMDGREDVSANGVVDTGETDPNDDDSDGDGLNDGLERGLSSGQGTGTDESWTPDSDTSTTTDPLDVDTDDDGLYDGYEDVDEDDELDWGEELGEDLNMNGKVEAYETDPNDPDTDGDGTTDDVETRENTFWYEAEDHANNVKADASASRGEAAINETDSQLVVHVTQNISDSERRVKVFVKCRMVDGHTEGSLRVTLIYGSEEIIENFDIGDGGYRWVTHPDLEATLSGSFEVYANDTHTGSQSKPSVWVDKIVVAYAPLTERYAFMGNEDEILFSEKEDSNDTLYLEVPNGTYVSSAVLRIKGTSFSDFYYGANITRAREGLTATVLSDGSVLVVGGYEGGYYLPTAELYDLTNDTWTEVGALNEGRAYHTAILLDSGKVLVAGGQNSSGYTDTAELYDPSTQTWSTTGDMKVKRIYHTVTLLSNGKVLAVGGKKSSSFYLDSAELYDPSAGTWSYTGDLDTKRAWHTASRLSDGDVLVAGGANPTVLSSAEIYDVSGGSWSNAASMSTVRHYHTATVLTNGTVLVAGGSSSVTSTNKTEMYNPTADDWYQVDDIPTKITTHTAVRLDNGDVLIAGGFLPGYEPDAYVYNTTNSEWVHGGTLEIARNEHAMALLDDGLVFVIGGESLNDNEQLDSVEVYQPSWGAGMMLDVGKDGDVDWYRGPVLFDEEIKIRFAGEVNEYIFRHPGETNQNDNYEVPLLFSSESKGKLSIVNLTVLFEPYVSDPCDSDSDGDDVSDYLEMVRYYTHSLATDSDGDMIEDYIEIQGIGTNPAIPDTDKDGLWDGFLDEDGDGVFDIGYEHGENLDLDVEIDTGEDNETDPLDPDSDNDKLLDAEETFDHAYWMEVEDYVPSSKNVSDENASHDLAAKAINGQSPIASITVDLPSASLKYKLLVKARVADGQTSGELKVEVGTYTETFDLTEDRYLWLTSDNLEFTASSQITIDLKDLDPTSVWVDKVMLINTSKLSVFSLDQASAQISFPDEPSWQVAYLKIPVSGNTYKYVVNATLEITAPLINGAEDPFMNIHERGNESFHQWAWDGYFEGSGVTSTTLDLAGEINTYIASHIHEDGFVDDDGYVKVPLWFHSEGCKILGSCSFDVEPTLYLLPYISDPLDSDTDSDFLLDGDEVTIFGTNMLSWDSDNDGLFDVIEPVEGIETSPTDSDSENDLIKDGDEVSAIFRAGNSSGDFNGYNDSTWIALPTMMFIDLTGSSAYDTWVPMNPKGNEYYKNAAYAIWLDAAGTWHLAWNSTSALDFNGTIIGQASITLDSHGLETGSGDTLTEEPDGKTISFSTDDTEDDGEWINFTYTGTYLRFNLYVDGSQDTDDIFVGSPKGHPMFSDFKYVESNLESGYDYDGISTSLSGSADPVAFNASFEKEMYVVSGNGSVYVKIGTNDYRVYERGSSSAVLDLEPTIPYALEGLEVYSNSAHMFDVDSDGIVDGVESQLGLDSDDADCDDDGLLDGFEHYVMGTDPKDTDSDNDGVQDGTEIGVTDEDVISLYWNVDANMLIYATDLAVFKGDEDPMTTTDPFDDDSDDDGLEDGGSSGEDENGNGMRDSGETDSVN
jgi:beta propeller repeat protein